MAVAQGRRKESFDTLQRKSPPFAESAKEGGPSSSFVYWRNKENLTAQSGVIVQQIAVEPHG
jgi:hypothetical protein